jgi:hypothetical protein
MACFACGRMIVALAAAEQRVGIAGDHRRIGGRGTPTRVTRHGRWPACRPTCKKDVRSGCRHHRRLRLSEARNRACANVLQVNRTSAACSHGPRPRYGYRWYAAGVNDRVWARPWGAAYGPLVSRLGTVSAGGRKDGDLCACRAGRHRPSGGVDPVVGVISKGRGRPAPPVTPCVQRAMAQGERAAAQFRSSRHRGASLLCSSAAIRCSSSSVSILRRRVSIRLAMAVASSGVSSPSASRYG